VQKRNGGLKSLAPDKRGKEGEKNVRLENEQARPHVEKTGAGGSHVGRKKVTESKHLRRNFGGGLKSFWEKLKPIHPVP